MTLSRRMLQAAAGNPSRTYIEDVFSTYLYTGNNGTQDIVNGIDLAGKGGLVWLKARVSADHLLADTVRGRNEYLISNTTQQQNTSSIGKDISSFNNNGFSLGQGQVGHSNANGEAMVAWTFRKAAKFFDVVTYTGNGSSTNNISHALGAVPGAIVVKRTDTTGNWCGAFSNGSGSYLQLNLNSTAASAVSAATANIATSSTVNVGYIGTNFDGSANANGGTYVAYLFAHDTSSTGLIQCGSFTADGSGNASVTLGWEPQWLLTKSTTAASQWLITDTARGWINSGNDQRLFANLTAVEDSSQAGHPTATGFQISSYSASESYIYVAIRRGPMAQPTSGTSVYSTVVTSGTGTTAQTINPGFPPDLAILRTARTSGGTSSQSHKIYDRLRGDGRRLRGDTTGIEASQPDWNSFTRNMQFTVASGADGEDNVSGTSNNINHFFRRAPGFLDTVCYTGTGIARTVSHNLGTVPELIIGKDRTQAFNWYVYHSSLGNTKALYLNGADTPVTGSYLWNDTTPTASVFTLGTGAINVSGDNFVAYLFATKTGISKVGSYTGTATTNQIDCGFSAGARFVMIKRTDTTGDWYLFDTARGIIAGNDPYFFMNSNAAEVTSTDYIDSYSAGFELSSTAPAGLNANGGTYIFLAIA